MGPMGSQYINMTEVVDLEKPWLTCSYDNLPYPQGEAIVGFVWGWLFRMQCNTIV